MARTMFCDQKITKTRDFVVELILILEYINLGVDWKYIDFQ